MTKYVKTKRKTKNSVCKQIYLLFFFIQIPNKKNNKNPIVFENLAMKKNLQINIYNHFFSFFDFSISPQKKIIKKKKNDEKQNEPEK